MPNQGHAASPVTGQTPNGGCLTTDSLVGPTDYEDVCFKLADTIIREGWLEGLISEALDYKPHSRALRNLQEILGIE